MLEPSGQEHRLAVCMACSSRERDDKTDRCMSSQRSPAEMQAINGSNAVLQRARGKTERYPLPLLVVLHRLIRETALQCFRLSHVESDSYVYFK